MKRVLCFSGFALAITIVLSDDLTRHVDPFIGTAGTGHCFPAACVPFGMVQAGADTGIGDWAHTAGYQYADRMILGFSQTHLSGTGCPDLGDVRILPFVGPAKKDLKSAFRKETEKAEPGWYAVTLDDFKIAAEVAVTARAAQYRFAYCGEGKARLLVDCAFGIANLPPVKWMTLTNLVCKTELATDRKSISGFMRRRVWVERDIGFILVFDHPWTDVEELPRSKDEVAPTYALTFDLSKGEVLSVKIGLSSASAVGAKKNLECEMPGWDFAGVRAKSRGQWQDVFERITVGDEADESSKKSFYTAIYHLCVQPNDISDAGEKPYYSTFSCWDTFRAAHPFYTLLCPERVPEMIDSLLEQGRRSGYLPIWSLWGRENQCMIGTHSVPVIVDAFLKGLWPRMKDSDGQIVRMCFDQIRDTLKRKHDGRWKENWDLYDGFGYYPFDKIKGESISRTLECAFDDWCAAQMAKKLGFKDDEIFFMKRASYWKNVYDASIGFMRGRDTGGSWRTPFNPYALGHGADSGNDFTEGNTYQYTWHVMQDPYKLIEMMGGCDMAKSKLDGLFAEPEKVEGSGVTVDVTGLIGQYVHGNEPSHHVIYFYTLLGALERTAEKVREVFGKFYLPKPDGLCGNDDCGQMSAWYLFSSMGFYPFNPCGGEYVIGAPQVPKVELCFSNGRKFTMIAKNFSRENKYVKSISLNGRPVEGYKINHADIVDGGTLVFEMSERKCKKE